MKEIVKRFSRYAAIDTQADEQKRRCPSNENQRLLAELLQDELLEMGVPQVEVDEKSFLYAHLPSNVDRPVPAIAFLAHLDTHPEVRGENVRPRLVENYQGGDILLNRGKQITLSPEEFPGLLDYVGHDLLVTDGTTLLGADGKAGITEIMEAMQTLCQHPELPHGSVYVVFTPDEELGFSTDYIQLEKVPVSFGFTLEGGSPGEINCENFNAAIATIKVNGRNIHPGQARSKMKNAVLLAQKFIACLPENEMPASTENYEGYYNVTDILGSIDQCVMTCHIRDFDLGSYQKRKQRILDTAQFLGDFYGADTFEVQVEDYYWNMKPQLDRHPQILQIAQTAMEQAGLTPQLLPVRGGTDGVTISQKGFPCPNLFSGGHNGFSIYEYISVQAMEKAVEVILNIIRLTAE